MANSPLKLSLPNQLVYETHEWSQDVYKQEYFSDPAYPQNLRGVWKSRWGYLQQNSISPVFIGAFDTNFDYPVPDQQWLSKFVKYMNGAFTSDNRSDLASGQKGMSWAVGSSGIGILEADFQTVRTKMFSYINTSMAAILSGPLPSSQPTLTRTFSPSRTQPTYTSTFRPTNVLAGSKYFQKYSTQGNQIVDESGTSVRMTGVNW